MKKPLLFPLAVVTFFSSCVWLVADDWTITRPEQNDVFLPTPNIMTKGSAVAGTDIVIKLGIVVNNEFVTGASKDMSSEPIDGSWEWDFPAPPSGWDVSDDWQARLYLDGTELVLKAFTPYRVISVMP